MTITSLGTLFFFLILSLCSATAIEPNAQERQLANLIINDSRQQRSELVYDARLNLVARAKARDFAERNFVSHTDPDGYGPNVAVELAGYRLPTSYGGGNGDNNVESLAGGRADASSTLNGQWATSAGHRRHIFGESSFYRNQTRFGVGYVSDPQSTYRHYWVFVTAPVAQDGDADLEPYNEWLFENFTLREMAQGSDEDDHDGDGFNRLWEFAFDLNLAQKDELPPLVFNPKLQRLECPLPLRSDLGSVRAGLEFSSNLRIWQIDKVIRENGIFFIPVSAARQGAARIYARK